METSTPGILRLVDALDQLADAEFPDCRASTFGEWIPSDRCGAKARHQKREERLVDREYFPRSPSHALNSITLDRRRSLRRQGKPRKGCPSPPAADGVTMP
jgi:hypothetical protein